jgi:membrane-associated protease RseP (regulator of RpoE activity)
MSEPFSPPSATYELPAPAQVYVVRRPRQRYWLHVLLLAATAFTTLVVGAQMEQNFVSGRPAFSVDDLLPVLDLGWIRHHPGRLLQGIPFAGTLMLILLAHEMGHYLYCVKYGVYATLPFFIPAPTLIGTLGAFIRIRSPIRSRAALFDIGIAGPVAGFVLSFLTLLIALPLSQPLTVEMASTQIQIGYPIGFYLCHALVQGHLPEFLKGLPLTAMSLHPMAIAAWVGMFATALNLLPGGQLDGGHIVFALFPRYHRWVSWATVAALIPMGMFWKGWWVWAVLLAFLGMRHPQVIAWPEPDGRRKTLAAFALLMLLLTFVPAPFPNLMQVAGR